MRGTQQGGGAVRRSFATQGRRRQKSKVWVGINVLTKRINALYSFKKLNFKGGGDTVERTDHEV